MSKNLVLDLGNVLCYFDFSKFHQKIKSVVSFSEVETMKKISPLMAEFNKGVIDENNFYKQVCRLLKLNVDQIFFNKAWVDIFTPNKELIDYLTKLNKKDVKIILASNTDSLHFNFLSKKVNFAFVDELFLSYKEGVIKPDVVYFEKMAAKYQLNSENAIFFDDLIDNVRGAQKANLQAVLYETNQQIISDIEKFIHN